MDPSLTAEELNRFLAEEFPQVAAGGADLSVAAVEAGAVRTRLLADARHLRPGGTVSGPTLFLLADVTAYLAIVARGPERGRDAVTTNLSINFLRRPAAGTLLATARLLKLGRTLTTVEIAMTAEGGGPDAVLAHAVATYALPAG